MTVIDKNNLVGIDAEWGHGYNLRMVCLYGRIDGHIVRRTLRPGDEPMHVPNLAYFAMPMDLYVARSLVTYDTAIDSALICNLKDNMSRNRGYKYGRKLSDRVVRFLGKDSAMRHTMTSQQHNDQALRGLTPDEDAELEKHCQEDAKMAYRLATEVDVALPPNFMEWCALSVKWNDIMKRGIHQNPRFVEFTRDPRALSERVVKNCEACGCDAFYVGEGDGKVHIDQKKMKEWFERTQHVFGWITKYTPRSWENYAHYQQCKSEFYQLSNSPNDAVGKPARAIYQALQTKLVQQRRVPLTDTIYQIETPFGQQSGRASPTNHLIQAGAIFRTAIMPPPGKAYVSLDIKSQEAVIAAHKSNDVRLREATRGDIYSYFASVIRGTPYEKLSKSDPWRAMAKVIVLSWLYGGSKRTFHLKLNTEGPTTMRMAASVADTLARAFPDYHRWKRDVTAAALYEGVIYTDIDRVPLRVDGYANPRQVTNHVIQGTAADMLRHVTERMLDGGFVVISTLFDGIYLEVDLEGAEEAAERARVFMEAACDAVYPVYIPWRVEAQADEYWSYTHPSAPPRHYFTKGLFEKPTYYPGLVDLGLEGLVEPFE